MAHGVFEAGELRATIGDNSARGAHRAGYNGIWDLRHKASTRNLFVPAYAGLNHEHIFSGDADAEAADFFEPRRAPMTFKRISDTGAELHQPPTPTHFLESWTRFELVAPHYLDMHYRCRATQHVFERGYIGLFWASYINGPLDPAMRFRGDGGASSWKLLKTKAHNHESTVRHRGDTIELDFDEGSRPALYKSLSPMRYELPLFYGTFEKLTFALMFDRSEGIRLTHSPSGGGRNAELKRSNPAWDFQFIIPEYEVLEEYQFRARAVLRPECGSEEVVEEFETWRASLED